MHKFYTFLVDLIAVIAGNWRAQLPSLEKEFMGFKRTMRHGYRNWRQRVMLRRERRRLSLGVKTAGK